MSATRGGALAAGRAAVVPSPSPRERALWAVVALGVACMLGAASIGIHPLPIVALFVVPLTLVAFQRTLLAWTTMLALVIVVILYIPIRRYTVGGGSPVTLEPYRILIAVVLACWVAALAADPKVRWRPSGLGPAIIAIWAVILASLVLNVGRVNAVNDVVLKQVSFLASYFLVLCFVASTIKPGAQLDRMIRVLVGGGAILALLALIEWRTHVNAFNGLGSVLPFVHYNDIGHHMVRGSGARALASAQHPIALGAALVMLMPLALYLFERTRRWIWLLAGALLTCGALSTGSRTVAVMLVVLFVCFFWLKRREIIRLLPLIIVLMIAINGMMPGALGAFRSILRPGALIAEQSVAGGTGSGRIADIGPSLAEWARSPFVGQGFGTRITSLDIPGGGAQILDNQWLGTLLDTGALGVLALAWLFCRAIRRLARHARGRHDHASWLATALAASIAAFAVGMFTFDAFAFIQVTFFLFIMLGFAAVLTREDAPRDAESWPKGQVSDPRRARTLRA